MTVFEQSLSLRSTLHGCRQPRGATQFEPIGEGCLCLVLYIKPMWFLEHSVPAESRSVLARLKSV